jgi:hypothetical protein
MDDHQNEAQLMGTGSADKTSATDNTPYNSHTSMGTRPYGMEYQVVAESGLVGCKSFFVKSS